MPRHLAAVALLFPLVFSLLTPGMARAAGEPNFIHVTTTVDQREAFDQLCSLREALMNANTNTKFSPIINECNAGSGDGPDVIVLQSGMTYLLTREGDTDDAGDLDLLDDFVLAENMVDIRIQTDGNAPATIRQTVAGQRVIKVMGANVELSNVAILNGNATDGFGGGILSNSNSLLLERVLLSANKANQGGGLAVNGNATLIDCRVIFNQAVNGDGGGIFHTAGSLSIEGGLIQENTANVGAGGGVASNGALTIEKAAYINENAAGTGGGIRFSPAAANSTLLIRNAKVENNDSADYGGGLSIYGFGFPEFIAEIENTEFRNNHAMNDGGAIKSTVTTKVTHSTFEKNQGANGGGAIRAYVADIQDSLFSSNSTGLPPTERGGALWIDDLVLKRSKFTENAATIGGALYVDFSAHIEDSQFILNTATAGGGIRLFSDFGTKNAILRSSFVQNAASVDAGGLLAEAKDLVIANTTFSGNTAGESGGGIVVAPDSTAVATNVTFAWNGPSSAIFKHGNLTLKNSIVFSSGAKNCEVAPDNPLLLSLGNNLVNDSSCLGLDDPSDQTGPGVDPMLAALADNGGNTQTHALLDGSPAIDAGDGIACANAPVGGVDQRGFSRNVGLNCDIGAFEKTIQSVDLFKDGFE